MEEGEQDAPGTEQADLGGQSAGGSGWTTTDTAARALGVSPRSVRRFIDRGELEGRKVKEGIVESWEVSINSLYSLRKKRAVEGQIGGRDRRDVPRESGRRQPSADLADLADLIRDLTSETIRHSSEAAGLRARLELTEQAQSTLESVLAEERRRREESERKQEQAERERDDLRRQLEALQEAPGVAETATGAADRGDAPQEQQEPAQRRSWLYRFFFGL
jgi:hypothetical protein